MTADSNKLVEFNKQRERIRGYGVWQSIDDSRIKNHRTQVANYILSQINSGWFKRDPKNRSI